MLTEHYTSSKLGQFAAVAAVAAAAAILLLWLIEVKYFKFTLKGHQLSTRSCLDWKIDGEALSPLFSQITARLVKSLGTSQTSTCGSDSRPATAHTGPAGPTCDGLQNLLCSGRVEPLSSFHQLMDDCKMTFKMDWM